VSDNTIKWLLFATLLVTLPVPYVLVVVGGFVPLSWIATLAVIAAGGEMWLFALINVAVFLLYAVLLYFMTVVVAGRLGSLSDIARDALALTLLFGAATLAFLPIYGIGHEDYNGTNIVAFFKTGSGM
jgi:hypothetical protein